MQCLAGSRESNLIEYLYTTTSNFFCSLSCVCVCCVSYEAVDFDGRLRRMGVASSLHVGPALPHGFFGLVKISDAARRAVQTAIDFLESPAVFGRPPPA